MLEASRPTIPYQLYEMAYELIKSFDMLEIATYGELQSNFSKSRGSVLIFLPGLSEIHDLFEKLKDQEDKFRLG